MRLAALSILLLLLSSPAWAQAPEYQVKAAMLANFATFVEWPAAAFAKSDSPFTVCVVGKDPFGPILEHELGKSVGSHPVQVLRVEPPEGAAACHMAFVSRSEQSRLKQIVPAVQKGNTLIVSDTGKTRDFCSMGGMIALLMEGGKVRFELNSDAAAKAGLRIDSRLKRMALSTNCGEGR